MRTGRLLSDERGLILRHIITIGLAVVVIGFLISELGPVIWYRISTMQDADDLASAVAQDYSMNRETESALAAAGEKLGAMGYSDEEIRECRVEFLPAGPGPYRSIKVTVVKYANTLLTRHIGFLRKYSRVETTREESTGVENR